jgi:hypothetical protein
VLVAPRGIRLEVAGDEPAVPRCPRRPHGTAPVRIVEAAPQATTARRNGAEQPVSRLCNKMHLLPRWLWLSVRYWARIGYQKREPRALPLLGARIGPGRNQATGSSIGNCQGGHTSDFSDRMATLRSDLVIPAAS